MSIDKYDLRLPNGEVIWFKTSEECMAAAKVRDAWNTSRTDQPVELSLEQFNSHIDARLTKTGGMAFDMWSYIRELENKSHGNPTDGSATTDWRDYYDNDYTPHSAIEEDFNYA